MIYGYCRCSTNESKQDINRQVRELKEMGASDVTIYKEFISGVKPVKVELDKLLKAVKQGDTIVVTEVSRITRSTKQLCEIIEIIKDKKLKLIIKNSITIDCTQGEIDPMTNAFLQIAGVFAELERNIISERVRSGMRNAKANNKQIGRPRKTFADLPKKVKENYDKYLDGDLSKTDYASICKISRPTLDCYLTIMHDYRKED